jgi:hypothetical protein
VPSPAAVAVPTVVPPLVHIDGAEACGPNTLNVIVPVAVPAPELLANTPLIDEAAIAVPAVRVPGAVTANVGEEVAPRLAPVKMLAAATTAIIPTPNVDDFRMKDSSFSFGFMSFAPESPFPTARWRYSRSRLDTRITNRAVSPRCIRVVIGL